MTNTQIDQIMLVLLQSKVYGFMPYERGRLTGDLVSIMDHQHYELLRQYLAVQVTCTDKMNVLDNKVTFCVRAPGGGAFVGVQFWDNRIYYSPEPPQWK